MRDLFHSEGTSIGMGDIYRLGDAVMAATNIKARHDLIYLIFHHCNYSPQNIFVTLGAGGCCFMSEDANPIVFPSFLKPSKVLSTSGAGDSAFGALIAVYTAMESWKEAAAAGTMFNVFHIHDYHLSHSTAGMHAASLSCQTYDTVNHNLKCNSRALALTISIFQ
jgi:sugar/nucleoside kinase (ribokinase family)